jgi:hypothetical protein
MTNRVAKTTKTTQTAILKARPKVGFSFMTLHDIQQSAKNYPSSKIEKKTQKREIGCQEELAS